MLYQPNYCFPNLTAIDVAKPNTFRMKINGGKCIGYKITILNNSDDTVVYSPNKVDLAPERAVYGNSDIDSYLSINIPISEDPAPFNIANGIDYKWKCSLYTDKFDILITRGTTLEYSSATTIKIKVSYNSKIKSGMKIRINNKIVVIDSVGSVSGDSNSMYLNFKSTDPLGSVPSTGTPYDILSDYIDTYGYFFMARKTPEIAITNIAKNDIIEQNNFTFIGSYNADSTNIYADDPIQYYIFNLYDSLGELIETTEEINSEYIAFSFDGFLPSNYSIQLKCRSQNGLESDTGMINFNVSYEQNKSVIVPKVKVDYSKNAINVDWSEIKSITGYPTGEYPYYNYLTLEENNINNEVTEHEPSTIGFKNGVHILEGNTIYYDKLDSENPLEITEVFTYCDYVSFDENFVGDIVDIRGSEAFCHLYFNGKTFEYTSDLTVLEVIDIYNEELTLLQTAPYNDTTDNHNMYVWDDSVPIVWSGDIANGYWVENDMTNKYYFNIIIQRYLDNNQLTDKVIIERGVRIV